ncbi:integumentary mucin C.1 [Triticum aestivum]|uniref:integumentary mucin C.1 n=1 Tax=Triticum aestivum TaxID=4565 RepID=UPI001D026F52|nr:integumentary mucin C.1-like [Triticum aestivum]
MEITVAEDNIEEIREGGTSPAKMMSAAARFFYETVGALKAGSNQEGVHAAFALSDAIGCKLGEESRRIWSLSGDKKGIWSKTKEGNEGSVVTSMATAHASEVAGLKQKLDAADDDITLINRQLDEAQDSAAAVGTLWVEHARAKEQARMSSAAAEKEAAELKAEQAARRQSPPVADPLALSPDLPCLSTLPWARAATSHGAIIRAVGPPHCQLRCLPDLTTAPVKPHRARRRPRLASATSASSTSRSSASPPAGSGPALSAPAPEAASRASASSRQGRGSPDAVPAAPFAVSGAALHLPHASLAAAAPPCSCIKQAEARSTTKRRHASPATALRQPVPDHDAPLSSCTCDGCGCLTRSSTTFCCPDQDCSSKNPSSTRASQYVEVHQVQLHDRNRDLCAATFWTCQAPRSVRLHDARQVRLPPTRTPPSLCVFFHQEQDGPNIYEPCTTTVAWIQQDSCTTTSPTVARTRPTCPKTPSTTTTPKGFEFVKFLFET